MAWTDERVARLKELWDKGLSASQIAQELGDGLSRNAVIGKAHRMGLSARPSPLKGGAARAKRAKATGAASKSAKTTAATAASEPAAKPAAKAAPKAAAAAKPAGSKESPATPAEKKAKAAAPAAEKPKAAPAAEKPAAPAAAAAPVAEAPALPESVLEASRPRPKGQRVSLLELSDRICKWPIGHPDEADFHFCGRPVNPGFPYCTDHCLVAYQAQQPRRDRPAGPPRPFGPNLPRPR